MIDPYAPIEWLRGNRLRVALSLPFLAVLAIALYPRPGLIMPLVPVGLDPLTLFLTGLLAAIGQLAPRH
jgi:hypothetical protein